MAHDAWLAPGCTITYQAQGQSYRPSYYDKDLGMRFQRYDSQDRYEVKLRVNAISGSEVEIWRAYTNPTMTNGTIHMSLETGRIREEQNACFYFIPRSVRIGDSIPFRGIWRVNDLRVLSSTSADTVLGRRDALLVQGTSEEISHLSLSHTAFRYADSLLFDSELRLLLEHGRISTIEYKSTYRSFTDPTQNSTHRLSLVSLQSPARQVSSRKSDNIRGTRIARD